MQCHSSCPQKGADNQPCLFPETPIRVPDQPLSSGPIQCQPLSPVPRPSASPLSTRQGGSWGNGPEQGARIKRGRKKTEEFTWPLSFSLWHRPVATTKIHEIATLMLHTPSGHLCPANKKTRGVVPEFPWSGKQKDPSTWGMQMGERRRQEQEMGRLSEP